MSGLCEGQCRASPHLPAKPGRNHTGTKGNGGEGDAQKMHGLPPAYRTATPPAATRHRGRVPPQFLFRFTSPDPRAYADGQPGLHTPGLCCTVNNVFRAAPSPSAHAGQRRFTARPRENSGGRLPQFFLGTFSSLPADRAQMDRSGLRERCYTPHQPLRQAVQLRVKCERLPPFSRADRVRPI